MGNSDDDDSKNDRKAFTLVWPQVMDEKPGL